MKVPTTLSDALFVICDCNSKREMMSLSRLQCPTSTMGSDWWTVMPWSVSHPSASPQRLHQFSAWPGFRLHRACSSQEVKATQDWETAQSQSSITTVTLQEQTKIFTLKRYQVDLNLRAPFSESIKLK